MTSSRMDDQASPFTPKAASTAAHLHSDCNHQLSGYQKSDAAPNIGNIVDIRPPRSSPAASTEFNPSTNQRQHDSSGPRAVIYAGTISGLDNAGWSRRMEEAYAYPVSSHQVTSNAVYGWWYGVQAPIAPPRISSPDLNSYQPAGGKWGGANPNKPRE